jgi:hypothetical protein
MLRLPGVSSPEPRVRGGRPPFPDRGRPPFLEEEPRASLGLVDLRLSASPTQVSIKFARARSCFSQSACVSIFAACCLLSSRSFPARAPGAEKQATVRAGLARQKSRGVVRELPHAPSQGASAVSLRKIRIGTDLDVGVPLCPSRL